MTRKFTELPLSKDVLKALDKMAFVKMTKVQDRVIEHILEGKDVIVKAKTGSGKTAAFGVPLVERMTAKNSAPKALILTPTRELAIQVNQDVANIAKYKNVKTTAVYGQHNMNVEIEALTKGVSIVTGTPGRVYDHLQRQTLYTKDIEYLVLDEADRMLDMGFIDQVMQIVAYLPKKRITMLFSATMPFEVQTIAWQYMKQPMTVEIESETKTVDIISQSYYRVEPFEKRKQLHRLLTYKKPNSCMIFCNTRRAVDRVASFLNAKGYRAEALHGALTQTRRLKTINKFKNSKFTMLVATDVAARGIHVEDLELVINYDLPEEKDAYIHRIGRTGRAGNKGSAFSLITSNDIMMLYEIEEHIGVLIEEKTLPKSSEIYKKRTSAKKSKSKSAVKKQVYDAQAKQLSRKVYRGKTLSSNQSYIKAEHDKSLEQNKRYNKYSTDKVDEIVKAYCGSKIKVRSSLLKRIFGRLFK